MVKSKLIVLLAVTVLAASLLYVFRDAWSINPFVNDAAYTNISRVATDVNGSLYTISDSKRTVQKVDASGKLVYKVSSQVNTAPGAQHLFNSIAADEQGHLYALVTVLDTYGLRVSGEQILRISPDGSTTSLLYAEEYALSDNLMRVGNIQSLSVEEGFVYFFRKDQGSASLMRLPATDGKQGLLQPERVSAVAMPDDRYLNELAGNKAGQFFFTTKRGMLFSVSEGQVEHIYPGPNRQQLNVPVAIVTSDHVNVYFIDYHASAIQRINALQPDASLQSVLTLQSLTSQYPDMAWSDFTDITVGQGMITVATSDQIIQLDPKGKILSLFSGFQYPAKDMWKGIGYWVLIGIVAALVLYDIRFIYIHVMKRRLFLLLKQMIVIVPVVLLSMVGLSYSVYSSFSDEMRADTLRQLELLAGNGKYLVSGSNLEQLNSPQDYMSEPYQAIKQRLNDLFSRSGEGRDGLYNTLYKYVDGQLYIIMDDDDSVTMYQPFPLSDENLLVLEQGEIVSGEWEDASGQWMYALGPLYGSDGKIIGIYETGKDMVGMNQGNIEILRGVIKNIGYIGVLLLLVITLMTVYLLSSIRKLRRNVNLIASGEWDVEVQIKTRDEVAELGERFNMMASSIRRYIQEVTRLSNSYFRFVPQQFLKVLGKTNMTQINLGEQANRHMTILVCNMRNFDTFSAQLTTEENFKFINSFLKVFGPVIREHGGFTSRYLGPGMLTLFPNSPHAALKAAVQLRAILETYNSNRQKVSYEPIDIGIAVHTGDVMIGIIGEEQRMEGSVVSNHVQLALDLERLSQKLGVTVLLTEETMQAMKRKVPGHYRNLGSFQIGEEDRTIELFDLYEGDPEHIKQLKDETKAQFEHAVELFRNGRFYDARECFVSVVKKNRYDLAAKHYFFACDRYFQEGGAAEWNHALRIS